MIIRILVVDPKDENNILVYQVPEASRNFEVLTEAFEKLGYEWTTLESRRKHGVEKS